MNKKLFISPNPLRSCGTQLMLRLLKYKRAIRSTKAQTIAFIPPAEPKSLGDDAMVRAICKHLKSIGYDKIIALCHGDDFDWDKHVSDIDYCLAYKSIFEYRRPSSIINIARACADIDHCLLIGADILDGGYGDWHVATKLDLLHVLQYCGIHVSVVGFSYKENASKGSVAAFRSLLPNAYFCLRDEASHERFEKYTGLKASLGADLAFLFEGNPTQPTCQKWLDLQKSQNKIVMGYNVSAIYAKYFKQDINKYLQMHVMLIKGILQKDKTVSICILPHDSRIYDGDIAISDIEACAQVYECLRDDFSDRIISVAIPCNAGEVKSIVKQWDIAVVGRMHLGIAALRECVPVLIWESQSKVKGLLQGHFEMEAGILEPTLIHNIDDALEKIWMMVQNSDQWRPRLKTKLPKIQEMASTNFDGIAPK